MTRFEVRFLKTVSDDTGHDHRICQRAIEVDANGPADALLSAQHLFCQLERIASWNAHADEIELSPACNPEIRLTPVRARPRSAESARRI